MVDAVRVVPTLATKSRRPCFREMSMNAKINAIAATILMLAAPVVPAAAYAQCRATSPDFTIALIELYTSEGCDSCPPADRWFSKMALGPTTARSATLAFHVDYWDRLGWRDRFGNAAFTAR